MTLTLDLIFRKIVSQAYIIEGRNPKLFCGAECHVPFSGHFDLDLRSCLKSNCVQNVSDGNPKFTVWIHL